MSDENQDYPPMSDAFAVEEETKPTFNSDLPGIEAAAREVEKVRAEESEPISRRYVTIGGEDDGKPVPENQSIDLPRAVKDIQRQRDWEKTVADQQDAEALAQATDEFRAEQQQQQQPQQQAQPEPQPQPQASPEQLPPGVDPEIAEALIKNPRLRAAVEKEVHAADQTRIQYSNATRAENSGFVRRTIADGASSDGSVESPACRRGLRAPSTCRANL